MMYRNELAKESPGLKKRTTILLAALAAGLVAMALAGAAPARAEAAGDLYATQWATSQSGLTVGDTFTKGGNLYRVSDVDDDMEDLTEVILVKYGSTKTKATVNTVSYKGERFEVDAIGKNAFNNARGHRVSSLTIGRNVDKVGAKAFYGCKKLKAVNMRSSDLIEIDRGYGGYYVDDIEIASSAFKKAGAAKVKVYCGKSSKAYQKAYKKAIIRTGMRSSVSVVR